MLSNDNGPFHFYVDYWDSCYSIFSFMCMSCRSLFVLLYVFLWPLCCRYFFDLRILITPSISSDYSYCYNLYHRQDLCQVLITLHEQFGPSRFFPLLIFLVFCIVFFVCFVCFRSVSCVSLDFSLLAFP